MPANQPPAVPEGTGDETRMSPTCDLRFGDARCDLYADAHPHDESSPYYHHPFTPSALPVSEGTTDEACGLPAFWFAKQMECALPRGHAGNHDPFSTIAAPVPERATPEQSIREMQAVNAARSARWMAGSPGWTTLEIAGELAGEVGELANVCKKLRRSEMGVPGNKVSDEDLLVQARSEMADVFIVLMLTASKLGVDLHEAVRDTFNAKSEQMGFPERLS